MEITILLECYGRVQYGWYGDNYLQKAYMFCTEAHTGTSVWKMNYMGLFKTYSLGSITSSATGQPLIHLISGGGCWWKGKGEVSSWKMSIHGNTIQAGVNGRVTQVQDNEFTKGAFGFFTVSQPTNFWNFRLNTIRALTLQEIIAKTIWKTDETNVIVNFNNQKEQELTQQACVNAFNSKGIHYEQVTSSANAGDVNTFLSKIGNRGKYVESSNYNTYMSQLTEYIAKYVKGK